MNIIRYDNYCKKVEESKRTMLTINTVTTVLLSCVAIVGFCYAIYTGWGFLSGLILLILGVAPVKLCTILVKLSKEVKDAYDRYVRYHDQIPDSEHMRTINTYCLYGGEYGTGSKAVYVRKMLDGIEYWIKTEHRASSVENWIDKKIAAECSGNLETVEV